MMINHQNLLLLAIEMREKHVNTCRWFSDSSRDAKLFLETYAVMFISLEFISAKPKNNQKYIVVYL